MGGAELFATVVAVTTHYGGLATVVGLFGSLIGFILTVRAAVQSRNAARESREAAIQARDKVLVANAVSQYIRACGMMEEIITLQRTGAWQQALQRYGLLRIILIEANAVFPPDSGGLAGIERIVDDVHGIEYEIEQSLEDGEEPSKPSRFNKKLSEHVRIINTQIQSMKGRLAP